MKNMKKFVCLALVIVTLLAVTAPALALSGGYDAVTPYLSTSTLKPGYGTELAVTNLQLMLIDLGYKPGIVDGDYGPNTAKAVSVFQGDHNLSVDGQCGRNTKIAIWTALKRVPDGCYTD